MGEIIHVLDMEKNEFGRLNQIKKFSPSKNHEKRVFKNSSSSLKTENFKWLNLRAV